MSVISLDQSSIEDGPQIMQSTLREMAEFIHQLYIKQIQSPMKSSNHFLQSICIAIPVLTDKEESLSRGCAFVEVRDEIRNK